MYMNDSMRYKLMKASNFMRGLEFVECLQEEFHELYLHPHTFYKSWVEVFPYAKEVMETHTTPEEYSMLTTRMLSHKIADRLWREHQSVSFKVYNFRRYQQTEIEFDTYHCIEKVTGLFEVKLLGDNHE